MRGELSPPSPTPSKPVGGEMVLANAPKACDDGTLLAPGKRRATHRAGEVPRGNQHHDNGRIGRFGLNLGLEEDVKEGLRPAKSLKINGRHDWIRTSDLFRVKVCGNL